MSHRHDSAAPRGLGVISSVAPRGKGFIFATDAQHTEIFIHILACRPEALFQELMVGDKVSFSMSDTPKGIRGHDVRRMTEGDEERFRSLQREHTTSVTDRRGNTEENGNRTSFVPTADEDPAPPSYRRRRERP